MNDENERERLEHPSFGQIGFSRVSSTGAKFYGSELTQDHYISMEIHHSEIERSLTDDHHYNANKPTIVRLRMSSVQFAEMITSLNNGSGTPCTLEYINGVQMPELPDQDSRKEFVHRKFKQRMVQFANEIKSQSLRAKELIKKKTLSKDDQHELDQLITYLTTEVANNIPFFGQCFQETMDKVVVEAKLEVENAIQHKINVLGVNALQVEQHERLSEGKNDNKKLSEDNVRPV